MSTATIPITLNISIELPDGIALAPPPPSGPQVWQYTAAAEAECGGSDNWNASQYLPAPPLPAAPREPGDAGPQPTAPPSIARPALPDAATIEAKVEAVRDRLTNAVIAARHRAEEEELLESLGLPISRQITDPERKERTKFLRAWPKEQAADVEKTQLAKLEATVKRLEEETARLRAELAEERSRAELAEARLAETPAIDSAAESRRESGAGPAEGSAEEHTADDEAAQHSDPPATQEEFLATAARPQPEPMPNAPDDTSDPDVVSGYANPVHDLYPVTARQQQAIMYLMAGHSIVATANRLGVARSTVDRWLAKNAKFMALLARHQSSVHTKLNMLCRDAADVMIAHVHQHSLPASVQVLKGRGFLRNQAPQPAFRVAEEMCEVRSEKCEVQEVSKT